MIRDGYRVGRMVWYWAPGVTEEIPPFAAVVTADMGDDKPLGLHVFSPPGTFFAAGMTDVWAREMGDTAPPTEGRFRMLT